MVKYFLRSIHPLSTTLRASVCWFMQRVGRLTFFSLLLSHFICINPSAIIIHAEGQWYYRCRTSAYILTPAIRKSKAPVRVRASTCKSEYVRTDLQTVTLVLGTINTNRVCDTPVRVSHVTILHSASCRFR